MIPSPFPVRLAWLLTRTASYDRSISIMVRLCFWGICIGTCALSLVAAIMSGFEHVTHQSIKGIHADLIVRSSRPLDYDKIRSVILKEFSKEIQEITPTSSHHVIIDTSQDQLSLAFIDAVDPQTASRVNALQKIILKPLNTPIETLLTPHTVVIGKTLAADLQLSVGDTLSLLHPSEQQSKKNRITLEPVQAHISGIFSTGIDEFDTHGIIASHAFAEETLGIENAITQINIKLNPQVTLTDLQKRLSQRLSLEVVSWKDLYPALISALVLEKYAMVFILLLIVLIASMNTTSLLFMFIAYKKQTIGVLYAMGMSRRAIVTTFITLGIGISGCAAFLGLTGSIALSYVLERYRLISLPDAYYTSYLPAHMSFSIVVSVFILTLALGFITAWYPTQSINRKKISQILKFET